MKRVIPLLIIQFFVLSIYAQSIYTISGKVLCEGRGVENVVVTDGETCVITDNKGVYSIPFTKSEAQFVYISTPAGYLANESQGIPIFYEKIDRDVVKSYDFHISKNTKDDNKHLLLVHSDPQFFKMENFDMYSSVIDDCIETIGNYSENDIVGIDAGDLVGDKPELYKTYIDYLSKTNVPFYRVPGNHDMNYGGRTHESSKQRYSDIFGPTRYSFNRGSVHYIMLDNSFYFGRDYFYMGYLDESTFKWLEQDLSYVPEGSTVFITMHIPARLTDTPAQFDYNSHSIGVQTVNVSSLFDMLKQYNVHIITGHMHYNRNIIHSSSIYEHNTAAVCGSWWQGDYCLDGTPIGYGVYEIDGNNVSWYFKSSGYPSTYQFRGYPVGANSDYPNDITVNVWNWDKDWKVEWFEDDSYMGVMEQCESFDPKVVEMCADKDKLEFKWISPMKTDHMFKGTPKKPNSKITIKVTDRFGNVFIEDI